MNGYVKYNDRYSDDIINIEDADFSLFDNLEYVDVSGEPTPYIESTAENYTWSMRIRRDSIKIGCRSNGYDFYDEFFAEKRFYQTNPAEQPEIYAFMVHRYEEAKKLRDKAFNLNQ